jgi:hypothetical protein
MPYDPRQLQQIQQLGRMGVGMMGPQGSPFDRTARPPQWWEQPLPGRSGGAQSPQPEKIWRCTVRTLVLGFVLLAANIVAAHAEDRKCIREMYELYGDMTTAKRQCDPRNFVTNPNEYGWVCYVDRGPVREKGHGAKQQKDAPCE